MLWVIAQYVAIPDNKAARLKAIKSLNLNFDGKIFWDNFVRSYKIMSIWLEKGKARAEMREVMRYAMKLAPKEMRSMIEFALKIEEDEEARIEAAKKEEEEKKKKQENSK